MNRFFPVIDRFPRWFRNSDCLQSEMYASSIHTHFLTLTAWIFIGLVLHAVPGLVNSAMARDVQPGLVATYSDTDRSVVRVVPTPGFRLRISESIHPQIDRQFTADWNGVLTISRAGRYRVFADGAVVELDGKPATGRVLLVTGEHSLRIQYRRDKDNEARLELRWESEFFREEPVPPAVLGHVNTPQQAIEQDSVEHGRFLFAELGCASCHSAGNWNLQTRRGPDLSNAGSRIQAGWLYEWLKNPHEYRKSAVMPICLETGKDRADVTAFVMSLRTGGDMAVSNSLSPEQRQTGRGLFETVGCVKCHNKTNSLETVGSKFVSAASLTAFIADPHSIDLHGRMPQLFRPDTERHLAGLVAGFLFHDRKRSEPFATFPQGDPDRGAKLFASQGCASCHTVTSPAIPQAEVLTGPAFGQAIGLPLRHYWDFDGEETAPVRDRVTGKLEQVAGRSAVFSSDTDRKNAFDFDGKTHIELKHFHRPDTMTISVWVKTTQGGSILTWGRPGGGQRGSRELRMNIGQDGKNSVCYGEYNSDGGWKPVIVKPAKINVIDGTWHHLAVVRTGTSIEHFIDGTAQGSGVTQAGGGDYTDRLLMGALGLQKNPSNFFKGQLDDLSVWDMALSAEQIASLAAGGSPMVMATPPDRPIESYDVAAGCLSRQVQQPLPDYQLSESDRTALQRFLQTVHPDRQNPYRTAPLTAHALHIRQFRCTACHELNDQNVQTGVAVDDNGRIIRLERPPLLTGAGAKLTTAWLQDVLLERKRNRPWLNLRMPHFGDQVRDLPELISSIAGVPKRETGPPADRSLAAAGLAMIGVRRGKVSCITCHDYRGINRRKDGVVPAPDLADAGHTVRREWFDRWMHDPQRLQPGTSMPQLFPDVSPAERELRIAQLWSALAYQSQLPLPAGVLDQRTEGTRIIVRDTPVIFRMATVTPVGQIDRAINVGIPGGLNFTFDAVTCRLRYAWKGDFLDAGPAWNGRGGNPVKAGGTAILSIPSGHTLQIGQASDTDALRFLGYRLKNHMPVFRYALNGAQIEHRIDVAESRVRQTFVVRNASADIIYTGGSDIPVTAKSGQQEGDVIRFPKDDVVQFEIEMPTGSAAK